MTTKIYDYLECHIVRLVIAEKLRLSHQKKAALA